LELGPVIGERQKRTALVGGGILGRVDPFKPASTGSEININKQLLYSPQASD
jgi:hypothetical protein